MKNKTFKKSLAMFLSFLMVVTSLVFVVPELAFETKALSYGMSAVDSTTNRGSITFRPNTNDSNDYVTINYPSKIFLDVTETLQDVGYEVRISGYYGNANNYHTLVSCNAWGGHYSSTNSDIKDERMFDYFENYTYEQQAGYIGLANSKESHSRFDSGNTYVVHFFGSSSGFSADMTLSGNPKGVVDGGVFDARNLDKNGAATPLLVVMDKGNNGADYSAWYGHNASIETGSINILVYIYDKSGLNTEVETANRIYNENATGDYNNNGVLDYAEFGDETVINKFVTERQEGSSVLTTREVTNSQVSTAQTELYNASYAVTFAAKTTALQTAVAEAQELMATSDYTAKYTESTRAVLETALSNAVNNELYVSGPTTYRAYSTTNASQQAAKEQITIDGLTTAINNALINMGIQSYTVTFQNAVGGTWDTQTVTYGSAATAPATKPAKDYDSNNHYTFSKWDTDFSNVTSNLTVKPVYTSTAHTADSYTVAVQGNNGTGQHNAICSCGYSVVANCTWGDPVTTTAPTCHSDAIDTYTCTVCQLNTYTATVATTVQHNFTEWAATTDGHTRSCQNSGCTETQTAKHTYDDAWDYEDETNHKRYCNVCGLEESKETHAHDSNWVWKVTTPATCTADGEETRYCAVCGKTETRVLASSGHSWDEGVVTTDPECTVDGVRTYSCTVCSATKTEAETAPGHDFTSEIADAKYLHTAGSCTVGAYYYYACSVCDESSNDDSLKWQAAAPGHQFTANADNTNILTRTNPTTSVKEHRYSCAVCGTAGGETVNPWVVCSDDAPVETAPTCTEAGSFAHTCDVCAQTWTTTGAAATGHSKSDAADADWRVTTSPTCETAGEKTAYCTNVNNGVVCGVVIDTAEVDATGHAYTSVVTTKATCEADGVRRYTCPNKDCENPSYTETITARGHNMDSGVVTKQPTYTEKGIKTYTCQNTEATDEYEACTYSYTEEIAITEDAVAPTGTIAFKGGTWNELLSAITFGLYVNYDVELTITANDNASGVASTKYYITDTAMTQAELEALEDDVWTDYDETNKPSKTAVDAEKFVAYAKITDVSGNVAYLSTNGVVFDTTAPEITLSGNGNADTKVYCESVTVTVTEDNLGTLGTADVISTIAPNGSVYPNAKKSFELKDSYGEWTVKAQDLAGNTTEVTLTLNKTHTWVDTDTTNLATEATCTAPATYYKVCSVCGAVSDTETFESGNALDHQAGDWVVTDKADCSTAGSKAVYCTRVNAGETDPCGEVLDTAVIPVREHTWSTTENDGYVVVTDSTCTAVGLETRTCVNEETDEYDACEHSENRDIPMKAHSFTDKTDKSEKVTDAICTTGTIYKVGCSECDAVSDTETWEDDDAPGHSFTSGVYDYDTATDKHSQKCANCDAYSNEEECVFGDWEQEGTTKHKQVCVCGNFNEGICADSKTSVVTPNTCTTDGYTTNTCTVCDRVWTSNPTPKTNHNFSGEYKINADGTHTRKCVNANCNEYGDPVVCTYGSWTADAENRQHYRKCVCGRTERIDCATNAHSTNYNATCLENAKTVYECNVCTNEWTRETAGSKLDHSYTGDYSTGNAATDTHQRQCVNGCGQWADETCSFTNNFKPSTNEGTTHKHTAECACGNVETLDCFGLPTGMTDATCTKNAYMNYECEDCGNTWSVEQAETALGHSYTNYTTLVAATCKTPGTKVATCDNGCGKTSTLPIQVDKNNHTGGTEVVGAVEATCQKKGYTGDTNCLGCGTTIKTGTIIPLADHDWDNGKTIRDANCIGTGLKLYTCKTEGCTKTEEREIAIDPTNHANVQTGVGLEPTCTEPGYTGATECTACHTTIKNGTPIAPLGHEISAWEIIQMPSEDGTQPGIAERCCIRCGGEKETRNDFYIDDVHLVIFHNYNGVRLTQPKYYITGDKAIRPTETPVRVEDDNYTYEFKGWDFSDAELNYVRKEMPVVAQYNAIEKSYAVTFIDASGKVVQTVPGNTPYSQIADSYTGETPTMPSDGVNNYTFTGWGIDCDYETGTATVEPVFVGTPIEAEEEEPNDGIFGWLIRWIKQLLASIGINL